MGKPRDDLQSGPVIESAMPAWATGRALRRRQPRNRRFLRWVLILVGAGLSLAFLASGDATLSPGSPALVGTVERVVDGDTLDLGGQRIRLPGLDAPEWNQTCKTAANADWTCGAAATQRMRDLTRGRTVRCQPEGHDRYGRLLAVCRDGERDIAEALVADGLAVATTRYRKAEDAARRSKRGLWQGRFDTPAAWRDGAAETAGNPSRFERFIAWLSGLLNS